MARKVKKKAVKRVKSTSKKVDKVITRRRFNTKEAKYDAWCMSFLTHFNLARASRDVGCPAKSARQQGQEYITKPYIQKKLAELQSKALEDWEKTDKDIIIELQKIGFSNIKRFIEWEGHTVKMKPHTKISDEDAAAIARISEHTSKAGVEYIRFALHDKVKALELLGRRFGLFPTQNIERRETIDWTEVFKAAEESGLLD